MANKVLIARSGGATGHTAVVAPSNGNLDYGELGWLNGTNRLFIGRATADPTSDPEEETYEITRTATATKTGMAGFASGEFDISAFDESDGTGGIVSLKDTGVANAHLVNDGMLIGATDCSLGSTTTAFTGLTSLDTTAADVIWAGSLGANTLTLGGSDSTVAIAGDLTVAGTTTTVSSTNLEITDKKIQLGKGAATQAALDDIGIYGDPTTGTDISFLVSNSGTKWTSSHPIVATLEGTSTSTSSLTGLTTGTIVGRFDPGTGPHQTKTYAQLRALMISAGTNVAIATNGTISATDTNTWRPVTAGGQTLTSSETLAFTAGANIAIAESGGAVTITATDTNTQRSDASVRGLISATGNSSYNSSTGVITSSDTNTWRPVTAGSNTLTASETLAFTEGSNITISESGGAVTISADNDNTQLSTEAVQDIVGAMFSSNTETRITATYQDADGTIDLEVDAIPQGDITSVVAGAGMTGGATSGAATVNCIGGTGITVNADNITIDSTVLTTSTVIDGGTPTWS